MCRMKREIAANKRPDGNLNTYNSLKLAWQKTFDNSEKHNRRRSKELPEQLINLSGSCDQKSA